VTMAHDRPVKHVIVTVVVAVVLAIVFMFVVMSLVFSGWGDRTPGGSPSAMSGLIVSWAP